MKYRSKIVLAYATVAFLASMGLGFVISHTSLQYETKSQNNNLLVSAKSCVTQMDENLERMDAILYYILSDNSMLDSITWLAKEEDEDSSHKYILDAKSAMSVGLSTDYIMKNSYRTVFFNQNGYLASSAIYTPDALQAPTQRLITDFQMDEIPYLEPVIEANGKSVIVGPHTDYWGANGNVQVYSLMKAIRGNGMGFLEVESKMEDLTLLEQSDPDIKFLIVVNGDELLYASDETYGGALTDKDRELLASLQEDTVWTESAGIYAKASSKSYDLTLLAYKSSNWLNEEKQKIFLIAAMATTAVFGISLLLIIFFSDILTRPIKRLQQVVEATNIENLQDNRMLEETGGPDEFQALLHSYQSMTTRLNTALQNEKRAAILQLQAQFDTLQVQVNPHFIYNVLNIISSYAVMDNNEVICEMCGSLGNMLRYSTNNKERYAPVEKEMEYLNNYFYLLKARYENRLEVSIDIDEQIRKQIIPKMTLQQLVGNCVKHGFQQAHESMHISVTGRVQKDRWFISIRDNGSGIQEEKLADLNDKLSGIRKEILESTLPEMEIGGMGIGNTYARCLMLYYEDCIFEFGNVPDGHGFVVTVGQKKKFDLEKETGNAD